MIEFLIIWFTLLTVKGVLTSWQQQLNNSKGFIGVIVFYVYSGLAIFALIKLLNVLLWLR